jgi:hypothetical protein
MPALALAGIMYFILGYKPFGLAFLSFYFVFSLVVFLIYPPSKHKNYSYALTDEALKIREGVFFKNETTVPIDRIHQIDLRQGPLESLTGHAKLVVTTAGSAVALRYLSYDKANSLADDLNQAVKNRLSEQKGEGYV